MAQKCRNILKIRCRRWTSSPRRHTPLMSQAPLGKARTPNPNVSEPNGGPWTIETMVILFLQVNPYDIMIVIDTWVYVNKHIYIHTLPFIEICYYLYIWHNMYISACWWVLRARSIVVSLRDKEKLEGQLKQPYFTQAVLAANYMTISFSVLFRRLKRWFLRSSVEISRTSEARPPRQLLVTSARFGHRNLRPPCHARASSSRLHWQWGKRFWFFELLEDSEILGLAPEKLSGSALFAKKCTSFHQSSQEVPQRQT